MDTIVLYIWSLRQLKMKQLDVKVNCTPTKIHPAIHTDPYRIFRRHPSIPFVRRFRQKFQIESDSLISQTMDVAEFRAYYKSSDEYLKDTMLFQRCRGLGPLVVPDGVSVRLHLGAGAGFGPKIQRIGYNLAEPKEMAAISFK